MLGDAEATIEDGVLVLRVDLRPADRRAEPPTARLAAASDRRPDPRSAPVVHPGVVHRQDTGVLAVPADPVGGSPASTTSPTNSTWLAAGRADGPVPSPPVWRTEQASQATADRQAGAGRRRPRGPAPPACARPPRPAVGLDVAAPASRTGGPGPGRTGPAATHRKAPALARSSCTGHRRPLDGHGDQLGRRGHLHDPVGGHQVAVVAGPAPHDEQPGGQGPQHPSPEPVVGVGVPAPGTGPITGRASLTISSPANGSPAAASAGPWWRSTACAR